MKEKKLRSISKYPKWIVVIAIFLLRMPFVWGLGGLVQTTGGDEFGTLASAAYFAGKDWSDVNRNVLYYGFGYSALLTPVFRFFEDPAVIHRCVVIFNTALMSVIGCIIYQLQTKLLEREKGAAIAVSIVSACFFDTAVWANLGMNETMLTLVLWAELYLLISMTKTESPAKERGLSFLLGMVCFYSFFVHTRSVVLVGGIAVVILCYRIFLKKWLGSPLVLTGTVAAGYVISRRVIERVQILVWQKEAGAVLSNSTEGVFEELKSVAKLFTGSGLKSFFYIVGGQMFSLFAVTGGYFASGSLRCFCSSSKRIGRKKSL